VAEKRDLATTCRLFTRALEYGLRPTEVTTDPAAADARVLNELLLTAARQVMEHYVNNPPRIRSRSAQGQIDSDARTATAALRPCDQRRPRVIPNLRRGHYELSIDADPKRQLPTAFTELAVAI
jgi:transposase, IS6 family